MASITTLNRYQARNTLHERVVAHIRAGASARAALGALPAADLRKLVAFHTLWARRTKAEAVAALLPLYDCDWGPAR